MYLHTKDYYQAMQTEYWLLDIESVPDNHYSDTEIEQLYEKRVNAICNECPTVPSNTLKSEIKERYTIIVSNKMNVYNYPRYIFNKIDIRLLALNYLPSSVYNELAEIVSSEKEKMQVIEENNMPRLLENEQRLSDEIKQIFYVHDFEIDSLQVLSSNVVMHFENDYGLLSAIEFVDARIVENELNDLEAAPKYETIDWEIYTDIPDCKYETHLLAARDRELYYFTVRSSDIVIHRD